LHKSSTGWCFQSSNAPKSGFASHLSGHGTCTFVSGVVDESVSGKNLKSFERLPIGKIKSVLCDWCGQTAKTLKAFSRAITGLFLGFLEANH
jgi:hypothetical protein